ncbi:MAG: DNA-methyltransferase [Paraclostridium sp.]
MLLFNDDCMNVLKELKSKSVDLVIIDPPYEMEIGGGSWNKNREYFKQIEKWNKGIDNTVLDEIVRLMKKVNIYIFCNKNQIRQYLNYFDDLGKEKKVRMNHDVLVWHKTNALPLCGNKYLSDVEYILFFREKGVKVHGSYATKSKVFTSLINRKDKELYNHPTVKPQFIVDALVENSSLEGDIVLDCYMGTGTTGASALSKCRQFVGIEIDPKHFETATLRLSVFDE